MAYNTAYDLDALVVATKAATVYAAQESSLFLGGALIPQVAVPNGSITAQVPLMGTVTATKWSAGSHNAEDLSALGIEATPKNITANIYAARDVLRDLGGIDPNELGRVLGQSVTKAFDKDCVTAMASLTPGQSAALDPTTIIAQLFDAAATIRGNGETGQLFGVVSPTCAAAIMKAIGGSNFAGGMYQTEAMNNGFVAKAAGITLFQSAYVSDALSGISGYGAIFSQDALRIAMFKNVDLELQRRASAVGYDIVANLHAGVGLVDATRGVVLNND